jgi:NADPH:quinone reductase-like Zn-dependent oxidoreductase
VSVADLSGRGEIGGRTVQIVESGQVECHDYPLSPLEDGSVRIRTARSAISPGTEMTYYGQSASNVHLHKRWNPELRLFEPGAPSADYPVVFGYRACGEVVESRSDSAPLGLRVWGRWRHTEYVTMPGEQAAAQRLPDALSWDDGADIGQMAPIGLNAVAFGEGAQVGRPAVVYGAGVIGLITAQLLRLSEAAPVHVVDRIAARLSIADGLGFETELASSDADVAASLKRRHGADGIPVVWECSGSTHALHQAVRCVERLGTVVAVGFYQGAAAGLDLGEEFHHNGVRIVSAQIGNTHGGATRDSLSQRCLELALTGDLVLGGLPRLTLPVEEAARAFARLQSPDEVLQVVLTYD